MKKISDDYYTHLRTDGKEGWGRNLTQEDVDALVDANCLWDFTRRPRDQEEADRIGVQPNGWLKASNGYHPTAAEVNVWAQKGVGLGGSGRYVCAEARAKKLGIAKHCEFCKGEGNLFYSPEIKKLQEAFEGYEPPVGEGYQLWETTSEGSPVSPVFKTLDELCAWCETDATTFGSCKATAAEWKKMLDEGFVRHEENGNVFI
jgi:hypothetical protein